MIATDHSTNAGAATQASENLEYLMSLASPFSRHWIQDAVENKRQNGFDDISEACDDFVSHNGKGSHTLANAILVELGEEPIFSL